MTAAVEKRETLNQESNILVEPENASPLEWAALWDAMKVKPHPWVLTTDAMYWHMIECVPPIAYRQDAFLVGEADHDNAEGRSVYACFMQRGNVTKARYMTRKEFNERSYPAF